MAITAFDEIHDGRRGTEGDRGVRTYTRAWRVQTDDPLTEVLEIRSDFRCPRRGNVYATAYAFDNAAFCRSVEVTQDENRLIWTVTAEYSTARNKQDRDDETEPNPLLQPAKIFWGFNPHSKPVDRAISSNLITSATTDIPIVNTAYDPFDPAPMIDDMRLSLRVEKNYASYDPLQAYAYTNVINSDAFLGADVRTWKVRQITNEPGELTKEIGDPPVTIAYFPVTFIFDFRAETWDLRILNAGYRCIVTGAGKLSCIEGTSTQMASTNFDVRNALPRVNFPWPLSTNGTQLSSTDGTGINYLTFQVYPEKSFAVLGVP